MALHVTAARTAERGLPSQDYMPPRVDVLFYFLFQNRLQQEIDEVIPDAQAPGLDDKVKLPYVGAFFAEIQRCANVAPLDVPPAEMKWNGSYLDGYIIPKDAAIFYVYGRRVFRQS